MTGVEAFGFGVDLLGSMLNYQSQTNANHTNMAINNANIEYQREAAEKQMQFQREERLAAQEYNSPKNQAKLYSEAGFNPYMMMEKGQSFAPTSAQIGSALGAPSTIPYQAQQFDLHSLSESFNSLFDNKIKREQAEALEYQNDNKVLNYQLQLLDKYAEIQNKRVKTEQDRVQLELIRSALRVSQKTENYRISQSRADSQNAQAQADMLNEQINDYVTQRSLRYAMAESGYRISRHQETELVQKIGLLRQQIITEGLTQKQISNNINKIFFETLGVKADNLLKGQKYAIELPRELQSTAEADTYKNSPNYRAYKFALKFLDDFKKSLLPEIAPISVNK